VPVNSEIKYIALKQNIFSYGDYILVSIRREDMERIRLWRNAQMSVLRQSVKLSSVDQKLYFENVIKSSFNDKETKQLLFSLIKNDQLIGYGGLVNISWKDKRAEMSFLLDDQRAKNKTLYNEDMVNFIYLIKRVIFEEMKFNRLFTETYAFRKLHISILEKNGFVKEGILRNHILKSGKFYDSIIHGMIKGDAL
jgi:RimJ/RimL family protein N-acetyltransferase